MERLTYDFCIREKHCWQIKGADNFMCKEVCENQDGCEKCPIAEAFDRLAAYENAMPLERAQELAQAEKDGRLMVLPVPVGSGKVAYGLYDPDDAPQRITTIECDYLEKLEILDNPGHEVVIEVDGWEIGESDIGKTVFLTREEAEAALQKREADDEADRC